jgi:uncharacterized protein HemX
MGTRVLVAASCVVLVLSVEGVRFGFGIVEATQPRSAAQADAQTPLVNAQEMMRMHEQLMAEIKAADAKLDTLVKDMNAATGESRVSAIIVVVNELVRQRSTMHHHMEQMHHHMMKGRGHHDVPLAR